MVFSYGWAVATVIFLPIVALCSGSKEELQNCFTTHVFPTFVSPTNTTLYTWSYSAITTTTKITRKIRKSHTLQPQRSTRWRRRSIFKVRLQSLDPVVFSSSSFNCYDRVSNTNCTSIKLSPLTELLECLSSRFVGSMSTIKEKRDLLCTVGLQTFAGSIEFLFFSNKVRNINFSTLRDQHKYLQNGFRDILESKRLKSNLMIFLYNGGGGVKKKTKLPVSIPKIE